jgi:hypothetical protein
MLPNKLLKPTAAPPPYLQRVPLARADSTGSVIATGSPVVS